MTKTEAEQKFIEAEEDFRQVPNRDLAFSRELKLIKDFLTDIANGKSSDAEVAQLIITRLRFL